MVNTLKGASIGVQIKGELDAVADLASVAADLSFSHVQGIANGTGKDQANNRFTDQRTLAASASESLDLSGVLTDAFGAALTFTSIFAILVRAAAGNVNDVEVSCPAANGFVSPFLAASDGLKVKPGGLALLVAPNAAAFAVVAGTGDLLDITNGGAGTSVTYDIIIIGRT